jgi:two-component system, cell cycle sensor histidine kinase and response regulator CckA
LPRRFAIPEVIVDSVTVPGLADSSQPISRRSNDLTAARQDELRILLADDDPQVRAFTSRILTWAGWNVTSVTNGREAVEAWPVGGEPFDLVILDIVMPDMNGLEAYREIARCHPEARFLFMSAYAQELNLDAFLEEERTSFVAKPFVPQFLVSKVQAVCSELAATPPSTPHPPAARAR